MRYGWSIDQETWRKLERDKSQWRAVRLTATDKNVVPKDSGIYMICAAPPGYRLMGKRSGDLLQYLYSPVYIGKSTDLQERFSSHCNQPKLELEQSQSCFNGNLDFWFLRMSRNEIDYYETKLIDCFGPPANRISGIRARIGKGEPA